MTTNNKLATLLELQDLRYSMEQSTNRMLEQSEDDDKLFYSLADAVEKLEELAESFGYAIDAVECAR